MGWDLLAQKIQFISNFYFVFQVFIYPWIPILIINFYRFYWKTLFKNVYYIVYKSFKLYFNSIGIVDMIPVNAIHVFLKVRQHGIQWTFFSQLEDLDYADDIALLSTTANHLQKKAQLLTENARKTGILINQKKTKVMCMNLKERPQFKIDEEEFEVVTDWAATSVLRTVCRKVSQPESTKQGIGTVAYVTYGNLTYTA